MEDLVTQELIDLFGTSDLLQIIGIKNKEAYEDLTTNVHRFRQAYLRTVIRNHPSASGIATDTPEGIRETVLRSKRLYVMDDVFKFFTENKNQETVTLRKSYIENGKIPDFPSLKYLRTNTFKGDERDYEVPEFETVAAELKAAFQAQMKLIREMQEEHLATA